MQNTLPAFTETLAGVYINGQWLSGGPTLDVVNPSTEAHLASIGSGDAATVDQAVQAASQAFPAWARSSGAERGAVLRRIAEGVRQRRETLIQLQSANNGKPLFEAAIDVDDVIGTFEYYAGLAE